MAGQMYFGTKELMSWIPAPTISADRGLVNWSSDKVFLNGGGSVRNSKTGHRVYNFDWPMASDLDLSTFFGYADRAFGDGPFYFVDPQAANYNLFPHYHAHPALAAQDAPLLYGTERPTVITTPTNTAGYPIRSAVYTVAGTGNAFIWFPIPTGWTLSIGAHGSATGSGVVQAVTDVGGVTSLTLLGNNTTTRTNYTSAGPGGVSVRLGGTGTVTLSGLIAQLRPTGTTVPAGNWLPGKGNSGVEFVTYPSDEIYSSGLDKVHTSATMKEVGAWL